MSRIIDDMDLRIIQLLQEDGRRSYRDIAADIGVTERTVRLRVNQLQADGIIQIVGIINPIKLGFSLIALIQIAVNENQLEECIEQFNQMKEVRCIALTTGEYHLLLEVCVRSHEELSQFILESLNKTRGITKTNVIVELKILKNDYRFVTTTA